MKEQKPQREWRRVPRLLPATGPPSPVATVEATLELMTARLAELVNARVGNLQARFVFMLSRACLLREKRGSPLATPELEETAPSLIGVTVQSQQSCKALGAL